MIDKIEREIDWGEIDLIRKRKLKKKETKNQSMILE